MITMAVSLISHHCSDSSEKTCAGKFDLSAEKLRDYYSLAVNLNNPRGICVLARMYANDNSLLGYHCHKVSILPTHFCDNKYSSPPNPTQLWRFASPMSIGNFEIRDLIGTYLHTLMQPYRKGEGRALDLMRGKQGRCCFIRLMSIISRTDIPMLSIFRIDSCCCEF